MARLPRYSLNQTKYLLPFEVERLRSILQSFQSKDVRNCLLIELGLSTGARATELLNLQLSDLNEADESVFIHGIKGSNDREIPLKSDLFRRLRSLGTQRLFPITYPRLYQIWDLYRPVPKKFHSLRHTFAIELYTRTKDIRLLQVALGHRNITNTMIYADYLYSKQELRRLIVEV